MTDSEWEALLADLRAIETDDDLDRAVAAASRMAALDDRSRLPALRAMVETADFFELEAIAAPIANLEGLSELPLLLRALDRGLAQGHDCDGISFIVSELVSEEPNVAAPILLGLLSSADDSVRRHAAWLLGFAATAVEPTTLNGALKDVNWEVREAAVGSLPSFKTHPAVFEQLAEMVDDPHPFVRLAAVSALGYLGDPRAIPLLESARDVEETLRQLARESVARLRTMSHDKEESE